MNTLILATTLIVAPIVAFWGMCYTDDKDKPRYNFETILLGTITFTFFVDCIVSGLYLLHKFIWPN